MKCNVTNVGRFEAAELILNGLTVVAGTNSSGKTTLGKAVYAATKCEIALLDNIVQQKIDITYRLLSRLRNVELSQRRSDNDSKAFNIEKTLMDQIKRLSVTANRMKYYGEGEPQLIIEKFLKLLEHEQVYDFLSHYSGPGIENTFSEMVEVLRSTIDFDDSPINRKLVEYAFNAEFEDQIASIVRSNEHSKISFENSRFEFSQGVCLSCRIGKPTFQNIIYIDDVYAFDNMQQAYYPRGDRQDVFRMRGFSENRTQLYSFDADHRQDLMALLHGVTQPRKKSVAEDLSLDKINLEANKIFADVLKDGRMQFSKEERRFVYHEYNKDIVLRNVASGIKSIALLELLVRHGYIHGSTCVIIDEPETHLHPEWQIKMAELLVALVQNTKVKILVNTHSPYFVEAVRVHSEIRGIEEQTKFYQVTCAGNFSSSITDVTDNISSIYEALAKPYRTLDEEYQKGQ